MCKVISLVICKGGAGKTTSTINISSYIAMQGKRVCVIDLDSHHNLTTYFGVKQSDLKGRTTIADILTYAMDLYGDMEKSMLDKIVRQSIIKTMTVDLIPATPCFRQVG